jgi:hypothetical protein
MNRTALTRRGLTLAGPLVMMVIPKCPLCLLPFFAAVGIAAPSGPVLQAIIAAAVILWISWLIRMTKSRAVLAVAFLAAALVLIGRVLLITAVTWIGIGLMVAVALVQLTSRERVCSGSCTPHRPIN